MEEETIQTQTEVQGTGETSIPAEIEYATASQLDSILERINAGETPRIVDTPVANTWLCILEGSLGSVLVNEHQLAVLQAAITLRDTPVPETGAVSENPTEGTEGETAGTEEPFLTEEEQRLLDEAIDSIHQEIPENSPTLLVDETTVRFSSAIWYEAIQKKAIILAGIGGIGRFGNLINF